jgi:histidinol-phosphate phosphatase family protein
MRVNAGGVPPVFLDRDGTLIVERHYLRDVELVALEEGVADGLIRLQQHGHALIVVSNQSGIGRGLFTVDDAQRVNARIAALLRPFGIEILAWYTCPHAPETACECRKPLPGMPFKASRDWQLELAGSYVVGDKQCDLELADAIGGTGILVTTGHGREALAWAERTSRTVCTGLADAADHILAAHRP